VSKTSRPVAGLVIATRCAVVSLGISIPLFDELISRAAELLGVVVPMPTCALTNKLKHTGVNKTMLLRNKNRYFFITKIYKCRREM
jgi:hypothetical protein